MYKKIIIVVISLIVQIILGSFLLSIMIFSDSRASLIETIVYYILVLLPYVIVLINYFKEKNIVKSILITSWLYFLSAIILTYLPLIDNFYVTGVGGVWLTSLSVMVIHAIILILTLFTIKKWIGIIKLFKKQIPIITLCLIFSFFLFWFFSTFASYIEPHSYLALWILDFKDIIYYIKFAVMKGFFDTFYYIIYLFFIVIYSIIFFLLLKYKKLKFWKKIIIYFLPIWMTIFIYSLINSQNIQQNLSYNFANFNSIWDYHSSIKPYNIEFNEKELIVWCNKNPEITKKSIKCWEGFEIISNNKLISENLSINKNKDILGGIIFNTGLFKDISLYPDTTGNCVYWKNNIEIDDTIFTVNTKRCNTRNFPTLASIEWEEFSLPLMQCLWREKCEIRTMYSIIHE